MILHKVWDNIRVHIYTASVFLKSISVYFKCRWLPASNNAFKFLYKQNKNLFIFIPVLVLRYGSNTHDDTVDEKYKYYLKSTSICCGIDRFLVVSMQTLI